MALAPWLLVRLWRLGGLWPVSACALALALLNSHTGMEHGVSALALWVVTSLAAWRVHEVSQAMLRLTCGGILLCVLGLSVYQLHAVLQQLVWQSPRTVLSDGFFKVAAFPTVAAGAFAALLFIAGKRRAGAWTAMGLSALLLLTTLRHWDQRHDLVRAVEAAPAAAHPFAAHLPAHVTVYWPDHLLPVWALLERPSHYAAQQGAGVLFNRHTGLVFGPRREMYRLINEDRERCTTGASMARSQAAWLNCEMPAPDRLVALCSQPDAPDFLVLRNRLAAAPLATWRPPEHRDPPQTYHLHACSQLKPLGTA